MSPRDTRGAETAAARNVEDIARLERDELKRLSLGQRIGFAITSFAGTFGFALGHVLAFIAWTLWNSFGPSSLRWDPYPYGLLTMIVSMEGVVIAVFVLIAQNQMTRQSDTRDHLNLQVDLLAEQEMTMVLRLLNRIAEHLKLPPDEKEQRETSELLRQTNVYELIEEMKKRIR